MALPSFQSAWDLADASDESRTAPSANIVSTPSWLLLRRPPRLLVYFTNDRLGRRPSLIGAGIIFNIGVTLQMIGGGSIGLFYADRALIGLEVGSSFVVIPQYIAECASAAIRGALMGLFEIVLQMGAAYVPATFLILGMFWAVESPRHSVAQGHLEKAIKDLQWLRKLPADHIHIRTMIASIKHRIENEGGSFTQGQGSLLSVAKEAFSPSILPRLCIGIWIQLFPNFTGINGVNYFSPTIFRSIGFIGTSVKLLATGVYEAMKTIFSIYSRERSQASFLIAP
ncbi:hypothetical protein QQZ08_005504 [Neonectria magnoliae]|uniref:Major facilitator superfamily (MFS) profile domain-containing protein n=1 Tax=Neonectria magnoliae TaxID=2732573 RepID=A0ABR1I5A2_9HYPO